MRSSRERCGERGQIVANQDGFIPVAEPFIGSRELELVTECVRSTWVSSCGEYITRFERGFAEYCGTSYGVVTSNGTTALHLALAVLGIGPGDEVIVPALTFVATANAVAYTGATPVFVDSDPYTWNMDPADVRRKITSRTRVVIPVHLYGNPVDMAAITKLAREFDLFVIEDAAEAHGAKYRGQRVGGLGDIGVFSFYGNKIITTGEGGMLLTDNPEWAERAAWLRDHAMSREKRYWHAAVGYNYRMTNLQAALGVAQLERIEGFISAKRRNAALYNDLLRDVPGLTLPPEAPWATSVYWMYSVLLDRDSKLTRDGLVKGLKEQGIDSRPFFCPVHTLPPYRYCRGLPVAEDLSSRGINLPSGVTLTEEGIRRISGAVREALLCRDLQQDTTCAPSCPTSTLMAIN